MYTGFFAVDRRTWAEIVRLGMNAAVAYLVLARGSGRDNQTTSWSVDAVRRHAGLTLGRAQQALKTLLDASWVRKTVGGTRPRYELPRYSDVAAIKAAGRPPLTYSEKAILDLVRQKAWLPAKARKTADAMVSTGSLTRDDRGNYTEALPVDETPQLIWLPNTIINGAAGELPPVALIRQSGEPMLLRLFVDAYYSHALCDDGGIRHSLVWAEYERTRLADRQSFVVWGFRPTGVHFASPHADLTQDHWEGDPRPFFGRFRTLATLGLVDWVPHLLESDDTDAQPIHAYGTNWGGPDSTIEDELSRAAHVAAYALLNAAERESADHGQWFLAPVLRHVPMPQMKGIARLRYRPHTRATQQWWKELHQKGTQFLSQYRHIAESFGKSVIGVAAEESQHQGDIKVDQGDIKVDQRESMCINEPGAS